MGSKKGDISRAGIAAIRKSNKGNKWGRPKTNKKAILTESPGAGAGIVTVYGASGEIKGTINPWSREFTPNGGMSG